MDISDPAAPSEVTSAFMPTSVGSYAGEGIQVIRMDNQHFSGDLLIHQNETCPFGPPPAVPNLADGISLWNVTDPLHPTPVTLHTGDFTNPNGGRDPAPNQTHSIRVWTNAFDKRTYAVLVDEEELTDIDILDITNPFAPVLLNDTLDLDEPPFEVDQPTPPNLTASFSHDMTGSISQIDTYTVPEAQDPAFATDYGHLSEHEVAMAPENGIAYLSYYSAGLRVVQYGKDGIHEVGAFIDEGGNNFWGVEVWHDENGEEFVLASDRDFGLYILKHTP